ncbi:hypothetical protein BWX40_01290 [Prevotella intermedia]|nr:hypothetical protein BWX40_01290 [Prevotella intermedia]
MTTPTAKQTCTNSYPLSYFTEAENNVKNFSKHIYHVTSSLSTHYKTYCFAFQKRLFCTVKA